MRHLHLRKHVRNSQRHGPPKFEPIVVLFSLLLVPRSSNVKSSFFWGALWVSLLEHLKTNLVLLFFFFLHVWPSLVPSNKGKGLGFDDLHSFLYRFLLFGQSQPPRSFSLRNPRDRQTAGGRGRYDLCPESLSSSATASGEAGKSKWGWGKVQQDTLLTELLYLVL